LPPIETLVVATHNRAKAREMAQILGARFPTLKLPTLADFPGAPEPEESGATYADNARIKSESAASFTGMWSLADDAGLEVDALEGEPGLHSKRFGGVELPFPEKIARLLDLMREVPEESRAARFRCLVALSAPPGKRFQDVGSASFPEEHGASAGTVLFEGVCEGRIALSPRGSGGFGYDPVFFLPEHGKTMADLTAEEKHRVSHRGKVLRKLCDWMIAAGLAPS